MTNQNKLTQDEILERKLFIKVAARKNTNDAEYAVKVYRKLFGVDDKPDDTDTTQHSLPWHEAPEWAQWAAMDFDGTWYWYNRRPTLSVDIWELKAYAVSDYCEHVYFTAPPFPGDWKDSLQRRPDK